MTEVILRAKSHDKEWEGGDELSSVGTSSDSLRLLATLITHPAHHQDCLTSCHNVRVMNRVLGATFRVVRVTLGPVQGLGIIYVESVGNYFHSTSSSICNGDVMESRN
jgi:hypothetical protein